MPSASRTAVALLCHGNRHRLSLPASSKVSSLMLEIKISKFLSHCLVCHLKVVFSFLVKCLFSLYFLSDFTFEALNGPSKAWEDLVQPRDGDVTVTCTQSLDIIHIPGSLLLSCPTIWIAACPWEHLIQHVLWEDPGLLTLFEASRWPDFTMRLRCGISKWLPHCRLLRRLSFVSRAVWGISPWHIELKTIRVWSL